MKINLEIESNDGSKQEVTCSAPDIVRFEDKFNISIVKLGQEMKYSHLLFLAHSALKRQKQTDLEFEAWLDTITNVGASDTDPK